MNVEQYEILRDGRTTTAIAKRAGIPYSILYGMITRRGYKIMSIYRENLAKYFGVPVTTLFQ